MGRQRIGDMPSVMVAVRIPGEWLTKLGGDTKAARRTIRKILWERFNENTQHQNLQRSRDIPVEEWSAFVSERPPRVPRKPKTKVSARASKREVGNSGKCPHGFSIVDTK